MTDPVASLRERLMRCKDITDDERKLIFDALNLGDYRAEHVYPPSHRPGSHPATTMAWAILDQIHPQAMSRTNRFLLAGILAGAFAELLGREKGQ